MYLCLDRRGLRIDSLRCSDLLRGTLAVLGVLVACHLLGVRLLVTSVIRTLLEIR